MTRRAGWVSCFEAVCNCRTGYVCPFCRKWLGAIVPHTTRPQSPGGAVSAASSASNYFDLKNQFGGSDG